MLSKGEEVSDDIGNRSWHIGEVTRPWQGGAERETPGWYLIRELTDEREPWGTLAL